MTSYKDLLYASLLVSSVGIMFNVGASQKSNEVSQEIQRTVTLLDQAQSQVTSLYPLIDACHEQLQRKTPTRKAYRDFQVTYQTEGQPTP